MKANRICSVCSTEYSYCPNCNAHATEPRWKFLFCSENCNDIFNICSQFSNGVITAAEAKKLLDKCDLDKAHPLKAGTKETIEKINSEVNTSFSPAITNSEMVEFEEVKDEETKSFFSKKNKKNKDSDASTGALS